MNNRLILILLIISVGINIGTFSILIFDRISEKQDNALFMGEDGVFRSIDLTDEQVKKIDSMRFSWFQNNDSLMKRIIKAENMLKEADPSKKAFFDSLKDAIETMEDSLDLRFENYVGDYSDVLDSGQFEVLIKRIAPRVKYTKIKLLPDSAAGDSVIRIIKKIEIEKEDK